MTKYQRWHDQIIDRARTRKPLGCYFETHHVLPRSLGGGDVDSNLVQVTYREHFLIHWLLTKICTGGALRRMQMALHAVTLKVSPFRLTSDWQVNVARKTISLLEDDPEMWVIRGRNVVAEREAKRLRLVTKSQIRMSDRDEFKRELPLKVESGPRLYPKQLDEMASKLLALHKRVKIPTRHSSDKSEEEKRILGEIRKARKIARR